MKLRPLNPLMRARLAGLLAMAIAPVTHGAVPEDLLPFGFDALPIPDVVSFNETSPRTVELLGAAFNAGEATPRRVELVRDLGACGLPQALPYLRAAMQEPDALVRAEAARSAGTIGDPSILPDLRKLMDDADGAVRRETLNAGAILKDEAIVSAGLSSEDPIILNTAFQVAFAPAHADAIADRIGNLKPAAQVQAILAIGRISQSHASEAGQPAMVDLVATYLDKSVPLRGAAVRALGQMKATTQTTAAQKLLEDAHPTVRRDALHALAGVATIDIQQSQAIKALNDPDYSVRIAAAQLIAMVPTAAAVDSLISQLPLDFEPLHTASLDALVAIGNEAIPSVQKLLDDPDAKRRTDGLTILWRLKSDAAIERQIALISDADWNVVSAAARSLGAANRTEAIPALKALAWQAVASQPKDIPVEQMAPRIEAIGHAIVACGILNHPDVLPALMPILPDWEYQPANWRAAICWVIGATGQADLTNSFMGMISNMKEAENVKFEAIKAMGNLRLKSAEGFLSSWDKEPIMASPIRLRAMAHWAYQRVSGKTIPYEPVRQGIRADTSITDLPVVE